MPEDTVPYKEPAHLFPQQWERLVTTWTNLGGCKTAADVRKKLGITDAEYIIATRNPEVPTPWLEKTANELQIDVTWILTGKTDVDPTVNQGATGAKIE